MVKKIVAAMLASLTVFCFVFTGCGSSGQKVFVQSVAEITGMGYTGLNSRYSGVVVSQSTQTVNKDSDKKVLELYVSVGDKVQAGDVLFTYDVQAVELSLKKLELEREQLEKSLALLAENIAKYEKKVASASESKKLEYEVQLQTYQIEEKEKTFELNSKISEIEKTEAMLENADVLAEVTGTIQTINQQNAGELDENGKVIPYMTIIETGAYRIKGTISEMDVNGLREGVSVVVHSRVDDSVWTGVVEMIEWDNPEQNSSDYYYYGSSENSASKYPFYIRLDSTEGLLMGQHVYIEPASGEASGLWLPEYYICDADGDAWVWAQNSREKIEKRSVKLGEYDADMCCYEILGGLTADDYIAFPDDTVSAGQKTTTYVEPADDGFIEEGGEEYEEYYADEYYDEEIFGEYDATDAFDGMEAAG